MQPVTDPIDSSWAKYGAGTLRPLWEDTSIESYSPLMRYPWEQTWAALPRLAPEVEGSPFDGVIMEYTNPNTGGPVMPTIAWHIQMLRTGERTKAQRDHLPPCAGTGPFGGLRPEDGLGAHRRVLCPWLDLPRAHQRLIHRARGVVQFHRHAGLKVA